jgi:quinol monooxygenase YgiN
MSHIAAFARLLEQAKKEPGTLLYAVHRSKDDPCVFWTSEVYTESIARSDVMIGETVMAKGLGR